VASAESIPALCRERTLGLKILMLHDTY